MQTTINKSYTPEWKRPIITLELFMVKVWPMLKSCFVSTFGIIKEKQTGGYQERALS